MSTRLDYRAARIFHRKKINDVKEPLPQKDVVSFLDLEEGQCRWPYTVKAFCGAEKEDPTSPYCAKHSAKAHRKPRRDIIF